MNSSQYSNERAEARKLAREQGQQTTQKNWDNYALGMGPPVGAGQQQGQTPPNTGEINKLIADAVNSARQSMVTEITASVLASLRGEKPEQKEGPKTKPREDGVDPVRAPLFNYEIVSPNNGPRSGIFMEIPLEFTPQKLHVLGIQGQVLKWVETEDC